MSYSSVFVADRRRSRTCHFYQMGRCTKGDKCGFAHVKDPDFKQSERRPPCHAVARGRPCPRGETCTYSHDAAEVAQKDCDRSSQGNGPLESVEATAIRDLLRRWRFKIPRDARERQQKPTVNLAEFLREALELVDAGAETMQEVINALASDGGRFRLDQMLRDCDFEGLGAGALERLWRSQLLPLLQIFSHESVLASRVVEMKYGTLLNELYGLNGTLAVPVFQAVLKSLTAGEKIVVEEFEASLIVLSGVLVMNGSASVNPEFQDVCETFVGLAEGLALTGTASSHLVKIRIRLGLGREIPKVGDNREKLKGPLTLCANFSVARKGPGVLYDDGKSRHDNDHADIREIQILPTMAEIQSDEPEYLPLQDPESWHLQGVAGVIDRHFRLVREDTVGQLRDVANAELERMKNPTGLRQRAKGMRTYTYHNIRLAHAHFDEHKGLQFVLSFDQPEEAGRATSERQRKTWWEDSKRLNPEALVCLLTSDDSAVFFVVASPAFSPARLAEGDTQQPLHDNFNLWRGRTTAYVIVHLADGDDDGTRLLPRLVAGRSDTQRSLIEFPGVVLPAFEPTLKALKVMEESLDLPFANLLCPGATDEVEVRPPAYARREGFRLNVRKLLGDDSTLYLGQDGQFDAEAALQNSTLDQAQQRAAIQALTHQVALIQGPPGTGKSYVGVKLIQVLLDNKTAGRLGPIVCVCFTNHALDQLLEHLVDAGVSQIVRIGSRSKSERLAEVNLRNVAQRYEQTKYEKGQKYWAMRGIKEQATTIKSLLDMLLKVDSDASVKAYLLREHPPVYAQLFHEVDQEGFQRVEHGRGTDALRDWLRGGPRHHPTRARPVRTLQATSQDVHAMSREGRRNLYNSWVEEHAETLRGELAIHISGCKRDKEQLDEVRGDLDSRVLSEASIIGVTTTGLARNLNNLRKLQSKVLIVEEAGEVLEAHLLTAMLPSVEHAILIGDHQQLRPRVQNYDLSSEKPGNEIGLDISLFERLVRPRGGESGHHVLPYSSLETQRRMHPDISQLIRPALYPNLKDAPTVMGYPEVVGMQERLFWLDHRVMEDGKDGSAQSTSRTNTYEVRMVTALVGHLVKQGVYRAEEIAVLTPYLGQLRRLRSAFNGVVEIVLNERDTDDLVREGDGEEDDAELEIAGARRSSVAKGTLSQALRLATVDNFQGEEAEVVIISLVRSNERGDCGFLKTSNRVNVLLSRAQHGMYIIGNSSTSKRVPMWHAVIEQLQNSGRLGDALALRCPRHPETPLLVKQPADFVRLAPEAGCYVMCGKQLPSCGHACESKCHSEALHDASYCLKRCQRTRKGCQHVCRLPCGAPCTPRCEEILTNLDAVLPCGHVKTTLACWQYQDPSSILCDAEITRTVPGCNHQVTEECYRDVTDPSYSCKAPCGELLPGCGHTCQRECRTCRPRDADGEILKIDHGECKRICGRDYTNCRHRCQSPCHGEAPCPLCKAACDTRCAHSTCQKLCQEPCVPCPEERCPSRCPHSQCTMPCAAPCDWIPCSKRCEARLDCEGKCQCPSLCGEACPSAEYCQNCASDKTKEFGVDVIEAKTYHEVDLDQTPCIFLQCGHFFTVETLDGHMRMGDHYELDETGGPKALKGNMEPFSYREMKVCFYCRGSLRAIARYGRIVRRALLDESTKKFIAWSNRAYVPLAERLKTEHDILIDTSDRIELSRGNIVLDQTRGHQATTIHQLNASKGRYQKLARLRKDIRNFLQLVGKEEQPFQRVRDMVETARRGNTSNADIPEFRFDQTILQTRGELLATALFIRCDLIAIADLIGAWGKQPPSPSKPRLTVNFAGNRIDSQVLVEKAEKSMIPLQQVEGHIFWAYFAALEVGVMYDPEGNQQHVIRSLDELRRIAHTHVDMAQELCSQYAGQTANVAHEVSEVRRMLNESTTDSEMRMVVAAMATEFSGTGHWYRCENGHPFTIGECGMPMETARCPQCNSRIGGLSHQAVEGVWHAGDIERRFGGMRI